MHDIRRFERRRNRETLRQQERDLAYLVKICAAVLERGEPTKFAFEASCRYALRRDFIFAGRSWSLADIMAAVIVQRALNSVGARRPSWYECQPEFTRTKGTSCTYCANPECGRPIERQSNNVLRYCSSSCQIESKNRRSYAAHAEERVAYAQDRRDRLRAEAEPRVCEWCSKTFLPFDYAGKKPQRFCGLTCRSRFASSWAASWRPARLPTTPIAANATRIEAHAYQATPTVALPPANGPDPISDQR